MRPMGRPLICLHFFPFSGKNPPMVDTQFIKPSTSLKYAEFYENSNVYLWIHFRCLRPKVVKKFCFKKAGSDKFKIFQKVELTNLLTFWKNGQIIGNPMAGRKANDLSYAFQTFIFSIRSFWPFSGSRPCHTQSSHWYPLHLNFLEAY